MAVRSKPAVRTRVIAFQPRLAPAQSVHAGFVVWRQPTQLAYVAQNLPVLLTREFDVLGAVRGVPQGRRDGPRLS